MATGSIKKILFITHSQKDYHQTLSRAISLAQEFQASLSVMALCPPFPYDLKSYRDNYTRSLEEHYERQLSVAMTQLDIKPKAVQISLSLEESSKPALLILKKIEEECIDLLVKEAQDQSPQAGFKALDMTLLRQCPCPILIDKEKPNSQGKAKVAVAIDPKETGEGRQLSFQLLDFAQKLASESNRVLNIVSCWDYEFEEYLRSNVWVNIEDKELMRLILKEQDEHQLALQELLAQAKLNVEYDIHLLRGKPFVAIPTFVKDKNIDILVMGTVGRTGLKGFLIGNTAENTFQHLTCSLLAMKPQKA